MSGARCARPTRLLAAPAPVEAQADEHGAPTAFRYAGRDHRVLRAWGPERIETGWWRGADVRRDYYCVQVESGERFWLFFCISSARWFVHGFFS